MHQVIVEYRKDKTPDHQYGDAVRRVLSSGYSVPSSYQGDSLLVYPGVRFEYDPANGVPLNTQRSLKVKGPDGAAIWKHAIGEICAFLNGVHTVEGLHKFGCYFWDQWGAPEMCAKNNLPPGDLGRFYGPVWTDFDGVNQIQRLMQRLREDCYAKHHVVTNWHPGEVETRDLGHTMPCRPCHGYWQVVVYQILGEFGSKIDAMDLIMTQRSGDLPIGVPFNTFQYAVLLMALAAGFNCKAHRFIHVINHCHIYSSQIPAMEELVARDPRPFPEVRFTDEFFAKVTDIRKLRREHVELVRGTYNPHPPLENKLPVLL